MWGIFFFKKKKKEKSRSISESTQSRFLHLFFIYSNTVNFQKFFLKQRFLEGLLRGFLCASQFNKAEYEGAHKPNL